MPDDALKTEFQIFIEKERTRLSKNRETILAKRTELDQQLATIDQELHAISAYEAARQGKLPLPATTHRAPRASTGTRGPRGEKQGAVLALIQQHPNGIARADILEKMEAKGDKKAEQNISNALALLKKKGQLTAEGGVYKAAAS